MPDLAHLLGELASIVWYIVLPLLLTMGLGYLLQRRLGLGLDLVTGDVDALPASGQRHV